MGAMVPSGHGESATVGKNKKRTLTRWQSKHKVLTIPSTMNNYTNIHYFYESELSHVNDSYATNVSSTSPFFRKNMMLGDMSARRTDSNQPLTTVIVIASIFLFITMSVTAATVVFCKKKNTVFVLNKSENDESEYEMEEVNQTDVDFVEFAKEVDLSKLEPKAKPCCSHDDYRWEDELYCESRRDNERQGYRRMVVSAVVNSAEAEVDDSPYREPRGRTRPFYKLTNIQSDCDSDCENSPAATWHKRKDRGIPDDSSEEHVEIDLHQDTHLLKKAMKIHLSPVRLESPIKRRTSPERGRFEKVLRNLPPGPHTIRTIDGKRFLVCELPGEGALVSPESDDRDWPGCEIVIEPDSSSIQGLMPSARQSNLKSNSVATDDQVARSIEKDIELENDPFLELGMSRTHSMSTIANHPKTRSLRTSASSDFASPNKDPWLSG